MTITPSSSRCTWSPPSIMLRDDLSPFTTASLVSPSQPSPSPPSSPAINPLDDVFDSSTSSSLPSHNNHNPNPPSSADVSDIPRLRSIHVTNGYRDGLAAGKATSLQAGFDEGYSLGAVLGLRVGWILGVLEGCLRALQGAGQGDGEVQRRASVTSTDADGDGVKQGTGAAVAQDHKREQRRRVLEQLGRAREELRTERVFGKTFFDGDGLWTYAVSGLEEDVTFERVADAHPLLSSWKTSVWETAAELGVDLGMGDGEVVAERYGVGRDLRGESG